MRNVLDKIVEKIKTHILCSIIFFRKSCRLWDNVENYGGAWWATNDVTIWRIRVACWISKATCTHAHAHAHALAHTHKYVIFIAFPRQQWFANAPQCFVLSWFLVFARCAHHANTPKKNKKKTSIYSTVIVWNKDCLSCLLWSYIKSSKITLNKIVAVFN